MKWTEVGIEPLRILQRKDGDKVLSARAVQRREGSKNVMLNVPLLPKICIVNKRSVLKVLIKAHKEGGELEQFLFGVGKGLQAEVDTLKENLENMLVEDR